MRGYDGKELTFSPANPPLSDEGKLSKNLLKSESGCRRKPTTAVILRKFRQKCPQEAVDFSKLPFGQ